MMLRRLLMLAVVALVAGCDGRGGDEPVTMSLIGAPLRLADPNRAEPDSGTRFMLAATAQGLVAFNADGQIEPALAERWIATDDGLSLIFRIRRTQWSDGRPVTAEQVAARLRAALESTSRNRIRPMAGSIERVIAMTGHVVEMRLRRPDPSLLQLLAQPELALFATRPSLGSGPYRVHSTRNGVTRLRPGLQAGKAGEAEDDGGDIRVRSESAARAIARFAARDAALVTGGGFAALPLARAARPAASQFQVDPAYGLFGLAVPASSKPLANVEVRRALAMAIDRERLVGLFGVNSWRAVLAPLPAQMDSPVAPAAPEWVRMDLDGRRERARELIAAAPVLPELRMALPKGAGARLLLASISSDWRRIGVKVRAVAPGKPADLVLIDEIAPQTGAFWYLNRLSCARGWVCNEAVTTALRKAGFSRDVAQYAAAIAEADAAIAATQPYIPLALPLRWSLVAPQITGWQPSAFAIHPPRHFRQ